MLKMLVQLVKPLVKPLMVFALVAMLLFSNASGALAARGGGRIGGGSFRAPARTSMPSRAPSSSYPGGGGGYYPGGGGIGFPLVWGPTFFVGGGFGGLFSILIFLSIASFIVRSFRGRGETDEYGYTTPNISIAKVQVGLLSSARGLQADLQRLGETANTGSTEGLTQVLQETTLSLLRHPEYWVYGGTEMSQAGLNAAEAQFNRLALSERSKFGEETLSNVNNQLRQASAQAAIAGAEAGGVLTQSEQQPGEYIVVTLLVAAQGSLKLPTINTSDDLRQAISQVGAVSSDQLLALEVLWTPQMEGDTLSSDDMLTEYPSLRLV